MTISASPVPTADGVDTLYSVRYGQTYHSRHGALAEAEHVFLAGTAVADRSSAGRSIRVLEVGFGTGLNTLMTARAARQTGTRVDYVALEHDLLPAATLDALNHGRELEVEPLQRRLVAWRSSLSDIPAPDSYAIKLSDSLTLTLLIGDATKASLPGPFDAVYLDAFSPGANPELWSPAFLNSLFHALRPGGRLATYSAKGSVRRALESVGFEVTKRPGPPGKRECIVAARPEPPGSPVA